MPQVLSCLTWRDHAGTLRVRSNIGRFRYIVDPGLYALGTPDETSPVLITANYKLSFDILRSSLPERHAWILVLDTRGINVWCAAGKGTFSTEELVWRIAESGLTNVVSHKKIILPQLSAPGIAAHLVKKRSGFTVHYGPVHAKDLPAYLDGGLKATPAMRRMTFSLRERALLIPVELALALKVGCIIAAVFVLMGGLGGPAQYWNNVAHYGLYAGLAFICSVLAGTILIPLLLPVIPGRAFSLKGIIVGLGMACALLLFRNPDINGWSGLLETIGVVFFVTAVTAYLAMNFTGSSTYTSLSGVRKEMRWALPFEIIAGSAGFLIWLGSRFTA